MITELALPSDPEEQALDRQKRQALREQVQVWLDGRWAASRLDPVLVRCDWDQQPIPQTQIRGRLVKGTIGVLSCPTHAALPPQAWRDHFSKR